MAAKKIIDMHFHCLSAPDLEQDYIWLDNHKEKINQGLKILTKNNIEKALVYILDVRAYKIKLNNPRLVFALMVDFRKKNLKQIIKQAKEAGYKGVKILINEQKVISADYNKILAMAKEIEKQKMFLTICSSFGGLGLYKYDALSLAAFLLNKGFKESLILAHAGGAKIKEAILLADSAPNVYLDTSFTVNYWQGSSVIGDLAYAVNRFPKRVFYGSDSPYIKMNEAYKASIQMTKKISKKVRDDFFYNNAKSFLKKYE